MDTINNEVFYGQHRKWKYAAVDCMSRVVLYDTRPRWAQGFYVATNDSLVTDIKVVNPFDRYRNVLEVYPHYASICAFTLSGADADFREASLIMRPVSYADSEIVAALILILLSAVALIISATFFGITYDALGYVLIAVMVALALYVARNRYDGGR